MKYLLKNTKITSTFGPSVNFDLSVSDDFSSPERKKVFDESFSIVKQLILNGVNCIRFNFSHGVYDENSARLMVINKVQYSFIEEQKDKPRRYLRPVSFLADTKGPEIRVFDMGKDGVVYSIGQEINVYCKERKIGSSEGFSVVDVSGTYNMANDCVVGNKILVEDGKLTLDIKEVDKSCGVVKCVVKNNHKIKTNKRINLPGADYSMEFLSEKDKNDIKYSIDRGFEFVALSFVNSSFDVETVRNFIDDYCKQKNIPNIMRIISKMETQNSCNNLDSIIEASDGLMIARGDLGLEIPYYEVPYWTKKMIEKSRNKKKSVIVATQMLDSLERNVVATRAEVSDVYWAAELGSDSTMLSGETAQGMFPALAVKTMSEIVYESEKHFDHDSFMCSYDKNIYSTSSDQLKSDLDKFKKVYSSDYSAVALWYSDVSDDFLIHLSMMRLSAPIFVFVACRELTDFTGLAKHDNEEYLTMKKASGLSLYRGINPVFVSGENAPLSVMMDEFISRYGSRPLDKVLYWKEDEVK